MSGEAALIPELESEADESVTLSTQERGNSGGVDSSGHGDGDGFRGGVHAGLLGSTLLASTIFASLGHS
jgi:hypothetical protein